MSNFSRKYFCERMQPYFGDHITFFRKTQYFWERMQHFLGACNTFARKCKWFVREQFLGRKHKVSQENNTFVKESNISFEEHYFWENCWERMQIFCKRTVSEENPIHLREKTNVLYKFFWENIFMRKRKVSQENTILLLENPKFLRRTILFEECTTKANVLQEN